MSCVGQIRLPEPILLIGGTGVLGRAWRQLLERSSLRYDAPQRRELDLTELESINRWVDRRFPVVVNCGAWTDVDAAEADPDAADRVNGSGVAALARCCQHAGARLLHYSTDYVFDGTARRPYTAEHLRSPVNAYGRSKLKGELALEQTGLDYLLIRTSLLYAPWGNNFLTRMARLLRERPSVPVIDDQHGRPTSCEHLVAISLRLLGSEATGVYHVTDGGECTRYEFACQIARGINPHCRVEPCKSDQFPRPAQRPEYSVLDLGRVESLLGPMAHWKDNLADSLKRMEQSL